MKTTFVIAAILTLGAPAALAQETGAVPAEFKFEYNLSAEENYEAITARANSVCRHATQRSDTFAPVNTRETVQTCRSELVDAAVAALDNVELSEMHDDRS